MRIWGKVFGFLFGFMFGKIIGALIGLYLGHRFDRSLGQDFSKQGGFSKFFVNKDSFANQAVFFHAVFSVYGHIAKASGQVTPQEIQAASMLMDKMGLHDEMRKEAQHAFNLGKANDFPLEQTLKEFKRSSFGQRDILQLFLEVQLQAAFADGELHPKERDILYTVARILGFSVADIKRLLQQLEAQMHYHRQQGGGQQQNNGPSLDDAYSILGVSEDADDKTVKKAWRKQMSQHHPDKLAAKGLPQEMLEIANQKAQDIQAAYEQIKRHRNL
ncbi:co-chaperone DjlA [Psychrobium sp. 1_MG-2023]|uniref:co-chaperone DjlA n=1 Tax=Psychrobium sp. 1_MG-2023 TaxID=3062624 RepID=UPI000C33315C|nr:co-chaperone DjlA [Psychrobium sp. 1_MG-2023]MDP2559592.1 co-chaperone DjlA [Psychrobium sp. 1_MG-2023]PKF59426.1 co-chaperone DjlA [Alteromonadales bacterium alter-6D02]